MARKPKRLRGRLLALELENTAQFKGVAEARIAQRYIPADYKIRHDISLNIYDAARSYREKEGTPERKIRDILKDDEFRSSWRKFRGGGLRHGEPTTFKEKLRAAEVIGWYSSKQEAITKLRNVSP